MGNLLGTSVKPIATDRWSQCQRRETQVKTVRRASLYRKDGVRNDRDDMKREKHIPLTSLIGLLYEL